MEAEAIITSSLETNTFSEVVTSSGYLMNLFLQGELLVRNEFLSGLPAQVKKWHRALTRHWWITLLFGAIAFLLGAIITGIVGGEGLDFWKETIQPWFGRSQIVPNVWFLVMILGCILFILTCIFAIVIYGENSRRMGQLETVRQENESRGQTLTQLSTQVAQLNDQVVQLKNSVTQRETQLTQLALDLERLRKETRLLDIIRNTDRELFVLLTQGTFTEDAVQNFVEVIFRRTFELWGLEKVHRASIYTPDINNPDFLTIKWDYGVGNVSRHWNRWYIGKDDPATRGLHRGIPGSVYIKGESRVNADVSTDPDQMDPYQPKRPVLPYRSTIQAVIHPDDKQKKLGVLCFDSQSYEFTQHDLTLVDQVATRIGWLMQSTQQHR